MKRQPLPTTDPFTGEPLVVTRLENPASDLVIEGRFELGWMGKLTREQLDFVGVLLMRRANLQRLASDLGIAYNTARSRLDDVVTALGGVPDAEPDPGPGPTRRSILERLAAGEIDPAEANRLLG